MNDTLTNIEPGAIPAGNVPTADLFHRVHYLEAELSSATAILDLVGLIQEATDLTTACNILVAELQAYLGCDRVAIGLWRGKNGPCKLFAVSGIADLDARTDAAHAMETALNESILNDTVTVWSSSESHAHGSCISHRKLANLFGVNGILSAPLRTAAGSVVGAWIFLGSESQAENPRHRHFIEACSLVLASNLQMLIRLQPSAAGRALQRIARLVPFLHGKRICALVAVMISSLLIPIPYRISVECEIHPVVQRYVAAPFAGEFSKSLAKPGDLVTKGHVLGCMEGRDVRWELAGLTADQERIRKSRDANMAVGKTAAAQMDQLELQRMEVKQKLLENRLQQLDIRSPVDGIVISGDLERSEGVPVSVGQVLFEVAPLQEMIGELAIPDNEIAHVEDGQLVDLHFDAYSGVTWSGKITRILPRSVIREKDNVFLADVPLDNRNQELRPGMKGYARISTGHQKLGWILFHKPWGHVVSWLGW